MLTENEIVKMNFSDYKNKMRETNEEGIVIMGTCEYQGYIDGVTEVLKNENVISKDCSEPWSQLILLETTGKRHDLVFVMNKEVEFNIGRFAIVKLSLPDCSWISDHYINYESHFNENHSRK